MQIELRKSLKPATGLATIVIVTLCYWIVRDTIDAASLPVRLAFCVLLATAYVGTLHLLRLLLPFVFVRLWPSLDR